MRVNWIRGEENIDFKRPSTFFTLGVRGSGKSTLLETIGEMYRGEGHAVLDLFGSRDGEGLAWLRAPGVDPEKVLLIHGDNVDVTAPVDSIAVSDLTLGDFDKYKLLISSSPLYSSPDQEFREVNTITSLLYRRMSWKSLIYVLVREAANLYYSRLKVTESQTAAKADMVYLIREARHMGVALGLDTLKFTSIDSDIRATIDYIFFKSQGVQGLPDDLGWMYGFIDPHVMRRMKQGEFVLLTRSGSLGVGVFPPIKWHKDEGEHILNQLGIRCEYGEELNYGVDRGVYSTLGDKDHADLVAAYMEGEGGMVKIAGAKGLSSGTVWKHINDHNKEVEHSKECASCRRAGGAYANTLVIRRRKQIVGGAGK